MHLILTGATGLVGSACLQAMLTTKAVTAVTILSRRPVVQAEGHEKVKVILHKDFNAYPPEVLEELKGAEGCVWALGISQTLEPNKDKYTELTKAFPLAAAKAFSSLSDPFKFIYVSGEGATTTPGMFTPMFGKVKGEAEAALLDLSKTTPSLRVLSVRPAGVDSDLQPEIQPFIPKPQGFIYKVLVPVIKPVMRRVLNDMVSPTKELGQVLVDLAIGDGSPHEGKGVSGEGRTISNIAFRRIAGI